MFSKQTIKDINPSGKIILLRTDFNVPIKDGRIVSDLRIQSSLPTIRYLLDTGASKVIIVSHLGRPDGEVHPEFSLKPVADHLQTLLPDTSIQFAADCIGDTVSSVTNAMPEGGVLLLENLRFHTEEEANSLDFARDIVQSTGAQIFVQDGFAVVHRAHASTSAITTLIPSVAGLLLEQEITALSHVLHNPAHPLTVLIGGAKVEDKQGLIEKFTPIASQIFVGGKIAADGYYSDNPKIQVSTNFSEDAAGAKLDVGPIFTGRVLDNLQTAKTVIWNGTFGKTEDPNFAKSSIAIAEVLGKNPNCFSVICGGDTTGFVENYMLAHPELNLQYSLISTGGGAALEFLSGETLPGLESLNDKK